MFGHQDDQSQQPQPMDAPQATAYDQPVSEAGQPGMDPSQATQDWQQPSAAADLSHDDVISPAGGFPKAPTFPNASSDSGRPSDNPAGDETTHDLIDIKQHALTELLPLIDKLDQTPAERFKTLLMMIQASDDQHLIKAAYESAHSIEDEKVRARALLDIVNEINYFTQQPPASA